MVLTGTLIGFVLALYLGAIGWLAHRHRLGWRQALLYSPLKLLLRIDDREMRHARQAEAPVIYVVTQQSRLDPALMLSLLPADTLHILDEGSARSAWLEPWRGLARTIVFNAGHVFVSRRLVRHLKGKGRLAVYFPSEIEPDLRAFRLHRAVARIAAKAEARVVPIHVAGSADLPQVRPTLRWLRRNGLPRLTIRALPPLSLAESISQAGVGRATNALALFDRIMEVRHAAELDRGTLFTAVVGAARRHGRHRKVLASGGQTTDYRTMLIQARMLARRLTMHERRSGAPIGLLVSEPAAFATSLVAIASAGHPAAPLDHEAAPADVVEHALMAGVHVILASRSAARSSAIAELASSLEKSGIRIVWLEELTHRISLGNALAAQFNWRWPVRASAPHQPALVLPSTGARGTRSAPVLSHRNLLADIANLGARLAIEESDGVFCGLVPAGGFAISAGVLLPLLSGASQSGPENATVLVTTTGWLEAHRPSGAGGAFGRLRTVLALGLPLSDAARDAWRDNRGVEIMEAYASPLAGCTVALNSATHRRAGTGGRLLPAGAMRCDPVAGIASGGRLRIAGDCVAFGEITSERRGEIIPSSDAFRDTGDLVVFDREGFVSVLGTADSYASIEGVLVSLDAVEAVAASLWPEGSHAALALPSGRARSRVVLFTTAHEAQRTVMRQAMKKAGLGTADMPSEIVRLEALPLLADGSVDPVELRRIATPASSRKRAA